MKRGLITVLVLFALSGVAAACGDNGGGSDESASTDNTDLEDPVIDDTGTDPDPGLTGDKTGDTTDSSTSDTPVWERNAVEFRGNEGDVETIECTPDGDENSIWGTDIYTDDSSICTAAVHAGLITFDDGGEVDFEIEAAQDEYEGTEANGVTSSSYGPWGGSFSFPEDQPDN